MTDLIAFMIAHPLILAMLASVLSILSLDLDNYIAFRKEHPGASYDWVVVGVRLIKGLIVPTLAMLSAMGYQAATS